MVWHDRPVSCDDIAAADTEGSLQIDLSFQQLVLESLVSVWMQTWGFGMGFHGKQGGEQIYAVINRMKHRVWSIKNPAKKLKLIMTDHYLQVAPDLHEK